MKNVKLRKIGLLLFLICMLFLVSGCGEEENNSGNNEIINSTISFKETNIIISKNQTHQLELVVPEKLSNFKYTIKWSSSDETVATVSDNGLVTGNNYGNCNITAKYDNGNGITHEKSLFLVVADGTPGIFAKAVEFPEGIIVLNKGDEFQLNDYRISPENSYVTSLTFSSSNEEIASVDNNGKILANDIGETEITLKINSGEISPNDTILVKVISEDFKPQIIIPIEKIEFDNESMDLEVGDKKSIGYKVYPENATTELLIWESSDKSVVQVDDNGEVTGLKVGVGEYVIARYLLNEKVSDKININVLRKFIEITDVSVNELVVNLEVGDTHQIGFEITPSNATIDRTSYQTDDAKIATVNDNGLITAKGLGTTKVTIIFEAYSNDNVVYKKEVPITVKVGSNDDNNGPIPDWAKELPSSVTIRLWENTDYSFNVNTSISHCSSNNTNVLGVTQALTSGKTEVTINGEKAGVTSINLTDTNGYKATVKVYVYDCTEYTLGDLLSSVEVEKQEDDASDYIKYNPIKRYKYTLIKTYVNDNKETLIRNIDSTFPYSTEDKKNRDCNSNVVPNETTQEGKYEYKLTSMSCETIDEVVIYERKEYKKVCKIYTDGKNTFENDK